MTRSRVHSRDLQPQIATPKGLLAAARIQRFDFPASFPTTNIDEIGNPIHVGTTQEIPQVTVTLEGFDVSHNIFSMLTGYTPATFPVSGASITELKNVDVIGQIRDATTKNIVNALYVKRGIVTGIDLSFGVRANSSVTYTVSSNSKKEFSRPVFYENFTIASGNAAYSFGNTAVYLTRTSGYVIDAYRTGTDGTTAFLDKTVDYTETSTGVTFTGTNTVTGDTIWVTYCSVSAAGTFQGLDTVAPAAVQGKYVPLTISVSNISRVQSVTIRAAFNSEEIDEMGSNGVPVGYENGIPDVTGEFTVLKTDDSLLALLEGVSNSTVENDLNYSLNTLPLKVQLRDPSNTSRVMLTYYIPRIAITQESDTDNVNQSINETFSFQSVTGDLIVMSGAGVY